jgi:hypothetical protein
MELIERIMLIVKDKANGRVSRFEIECGMGNGTLKNIGPRTSKATLDKIIKRYPDVRSDFLFNGVLPVYKDGYVDDKTDLIDKLKSENDNLKEQLKLKDKIINLLETNHATIKEK